MYFLVGLVTAWSLAVLAFERYVVICKPIGSFKFGSSHALMGVAFTWFMGVGCALPPFFGWSRLSMEILSQIIYMYTYKHGFSPDLFPILSCRYIPEGLGCSCGPDWYMPGTEYNSESYTYFLMVTCFFAPLSCIIFSYSQLLAALRAVSSSRSPL